MNTDPDETRTNMLNAMRTKPLDVLVVGGGIVGSSIARDAAIRGLRVAVIDRYDFAFGTSSRSSRLLHGGLRYLAQGRLGLVREASLEKRILHQIAPHLAEPLAFVFPTYRGSGWPLWQLRIGVKLYDLLCSGRNLGRSSAMSRGATLAALPGLQGEGLLGAVRYFDGLTNDARLVLDTLRSAAHAGATPANYARFVEASRHGNLWHATIRNEATSEVMTIATRAIVNATGPWADQLAHSTVQLRLTKGIHLVFERERLPVPDAVVVTEGRRLLFVIPWGERVIVGTTDTDYQGDPAAPTCDEADMRYLLGSANQTFPDARLEPRDVIRAWVGLRPLVADPHGRPSDISRSHEIRNAYPGWWDVAGGKLTTCRLMAEQTMDRIIEKLGLHAGACRTAVEPLLAPAEVALTGGVLPPPVERRVVEHACRHEWARHLEDIMIRRTSWHYYHRDAAEIAHQTLAWMAEIHGWSKARREQEWHSYAEAGDMQSPVSR